MLIEANGTGNAATAEIPELLYVPVKNKPSVYIKCYWCPLRAGRYLRVDLELISFAAYNRNFNPWISFQFFSEF